jgi:hypothetical protein
MHIHATGFQTKNNLSLVQLATSDQDSFDYVSCGRAIADRLIEVKEVNAAGSVNTIFVLNMSEKYVFLMDGDIFAGAKQNRVVNTSILLAPMSKTAIPVSCVEQGRWQHTSQAFRSTDYAAPASLRADKARHVRDSLREMRGFQSDQGEIWDSVAKFHSAHKTRSETSNLSDIYDEKASQFEEMAGHFSVDPSANGVAVYFGKRLAGIDLFNRREVYAEYFAKMLRGAAFEAAGRRMRKGTLQEAEATYRALDLLDRIDQQPREERPGVGAGLDRRFELDETNGFELAYEKNLIHKAVFCGAE